MRIAYSQSGGFAGLSQGAELDTEQMDPSQAARLEELVKGSGLFEHSEHAAGHAGAAAAARPDQRTYEIRVSDGGAERSVTITDSGLDDRVLPLVQFLRSHARPTKLR